MFGESTSESPRQPSPWDSRLLTPTGHTTPAINATASGCQHRSLIPEEDLSGHIEYKLRLPAHPSVDRLARLTSQLKWRLLEGGGEAIYELGVCDNGLLLGISIEEIDASINTLHRMADGLGAKVKIVRRMQVSAEGLKELPIDHVPPIQRPRSVKEKPPIQHQSISIKMPDAGMPLAHPPAYINKRRLTKKDRRTLKREREQWLDSQKLQAINVLANAVTSSTSDDEKGSPTSSIALPQPWTWTSTPSYTSTTPPANEIPGLSHSPSPPSSTASSQRHNTQASTASKHMTEEDPAQSLLSPLAVSMHAGGSASTGGSRTPDKPLPIEFSETQQAQYALRRHIRKEWKREKQHQKQLERSRHENSQFQRRLKTAHGLQAYGLSPQDRYLDGLAALFGEIALGETIGGANVAKSGPSAINPSFRGEADLETLCASNRERTTDPKRTGSAFSPTSSPLSGVLTPAVAITMATSSESRTKSGSINEAHTKRKTSSWRIKSTLPSSSIEEKRYAVECVISMPAGLASQECTDNEDGTACNVGVSIDVVEGFSLSRTSQGPIEEQVDRFSDTHVPGETCHKHKLTKTARPARERNKLQSFIDFETVWDELKMDI